MESVIGSLFTNPTVITTVFIGASVLILLYILKMFHKKDVVEHKIKHEKSAQVEKKKDSTHGGKTKKKVVENRWTGRNEKQAYAHPWLLTSLKGHTGTILDMNFSSNGKYLASCGDEDPDPDGLTTESSASSSSGSEYNKENSRPASVEPSPRTKGLSRRQRKNRRREDSPPEGQKPRKRKGKKAAEIATSKKQVMGDFVPLKNFAKFNNTERVFAGLLHNYALTYTQMIEMGYPVESKKQQGLVEIKRHSWYRLAGHNGSHKFDVNAREFVPKKDWSGAGDSGRGSASSSDSGENFDSEESGNGSDQDCGVEAAEKAHNSVMKLFPSPKLEVCHKRTCVRCGRPFLTTTERYVTVESCHYHWGRLHVDDCGALAYSCCRARRGSTGCTTVATHVWDGVVSGTNGPYDDFVFTQPRRTPPPDGNNGVYAIDCEMCYTVAGLEATKVTVVSMDGRPVYDTYIRPDHKIIDYNTRFSGITSKHLEGDSVKTLRRVQSDLLSFIFASTVLIGHGLDGDLRALRIVHHTIVDTAMAFPHFKGRPYRRSLRSIVSTFLGREIQCGDDGHSSCEDAGACMDLMLWRVRHDFRGYLKAPRV